MLGKQGWLRLSIERGVDERFSASTIYPLEAAQDIQKALSTQGWDLQKAIEVEYLIREEFIPYHQGLVQSITDVYQVEGRTLQLDVTQKPRLISKKLALSYFAVFAHDVDLACRNSFEGTLHNKLPKRTEGYFLNRLNYLLAVFADKSQDIIVAIQNLLNSGWEGCESALQNFHNAVQKSASEIPDVAAAVPFAGMTNDAIVEMMYDLFFFQYLRSESPNGGSEFNRKIDLSEVVQIKKLIFGQDAEFDQECTKHLGRIRGTELALLVNKPDALTPHLLGGVLLSKGLNKTEATDLLDRFEGKRLGSKNLKDACANWRKRHQIPLLVPRGSVGNPAKRDESHWLAPVMRLLEVARH